jgi:hypothetical protein
MVAQWPAFAEKTLRLPTIASLESAVQHLAGMPGERQLMFISDGFMTLEMHDRLERVIDEALHLRVIISALDAKGLAVDLREGDASRKNAPTGNLASLYQTYDTSRESAATDALAEIADATGGQFVHNTNDLLGGLRNALQEPEAAYVLTFSPEKLKADGAFHNFEGQPVERPRVHRAGSERVFRAQQTNDARGAGQGRDPGGRVEPEPHSRHALGSSGASPQNRSAKGGDQRARPARCPRAVI